MQNDSNCLRVSATREVILYYFISKSGAGNSGTIGEVLNDSNSVTRDRGHFVRQPRIIKITHQKRDGRCRVAFRGGPGLKHTAVPLATCDRRDVSVPGPGSATVGPGGGPALTRG
eukprot:761618-Hanusia_phi.AAC.1